MGKKRGSTPDDVAILVEDADSITLDPEVGDLLAERAEEALESVGIGDPVFIESLAGPIVPDTPDFDSPRAIFQDPASPTGWRNADGLAVDPETGEVFEDDSDYFDVPF